MISEITITDGEWIAQIHELAQTAYALEAKWIGCSDFPPLRESLENLRQSSDRFLVFGQHEIILGALSFQCDGDMATITRLVVSPAHFRQGIASALIAGLEARLPDVSSYVVSTAQANVAAVELYRRLGYAATEVSHSREGISLIHLSKSAFRKQ